MKDPETKYSYFESPLGLLEIAANANSITQIEFRQERSKKTADSHLLELAKRQLSEYFQGDRTQFDLPLAPVGTEFQKSVWDKLLEIPHGKTRSYLDVALKLGDKNSTRAIGTANGSNKIAIVIPCHRVIGSDGSLTGYAGGIERKQWLLEFEGAIPKQTTLF